MLALECGCFDRGRLCLSQLVRQVVYNGEKLAALTALCHDFELDFLTQFFRLFNRLMVQRL